MALKVSVEACRRATKILIGRRDVIKNIHDGIRDGAQVGELDETGNLDLRVGKVDPKVR